MAARNRVLLFTAALLGAVGCQSPSESAPPGTPAAVTVVAGDVQLAEVHDPLSQPVRFQVTDARGRVVPGVPVELTITLGDGTLPESELITDDSGEVSTRWTMGVAAGVQTLEAKAGTAVTTATARNCDVDQCYPSSRVEGALSDAALLTLATYEGSGQAVHPDVVSGHAALAGFWLAVTPYPNGDVDVENPSIFHSMTGADWQVPDGVTNPLAHPDTTAAYLSDPDLLYNAADQRLWLYYRGASNATNVINLIRSADGHHWDHQTQVLSVPAHQAVSPTIVHGGPGAPWVMWTVNSGPLGCTASNTTVERRTSTDGVRWSGPIPVSLLQPGQAIWHIDVEWIAARNEYWAIYNTYPIGSSCATQSLYIAQSHDGVQWTVSPSPVMRSGSIDAFHDIIYRATLMADPRGTRMTLWLSGAKYFPTSAEYVWHTATISTTPAALLAIAAAPSSAHSMTPPRANLPPPEPDGPH